MRAHHRKKRDDRCGTDFHHAFGEQQDAAQRHIMEISDTIYQNTHFNNGQCHNYHAGSEFGSANPITIKDTVDYSIVNVISLCFMPHQNLC